MSYVLTPYLVDLNKVQQAFGSRDEALVATLIKGSPQQADEEAETLKAKVLRDLIMGEASDPELAEEYGFALEMLCAHVGEVIPPNAWCGVRWAAVNKAGLAPLLTQVGPPVPLPRRGDYPTVGHLTADQVAAKVAELGDTHLTSDDQDMQELLQEYEGWLRQAALKGKAIVLFYG
jgi:hypothetical protein